MDYKTGMSGSCFYGHSSNNNPRYNCANCGQNISDSESYEAYGKIYCGCCYQSQ